MTEVEFLLARIAEADEYARNPINHWAGCSIQDGECTCIATLGKRNRRVLADCEAKRKLVRYAAFMLQAWDDKHAGRKSAYPDMTRRERHTAHVILESIGAVYADHPDFESWRP